jgi:formate dehydrogenase iron-sulfur subunit
MALREKLANAFSGSMGVLFAVEIILGGIVPVVLLARASQRANRTVLLAASLLTAMGIVLNRANAVLFAMDLKGPMPQIAPSAYSPSIFEWGVSVGLIAATIFLFGLGARLMPVLPKDETHPGVLIS